MLLPLIKGLWQVDMSSCIFGASRRARILLIIFVKVWMRLIGLKSEMDSTSSFFWNEDDICFV